MVRPLTSIGFEVEEARTITLGRRFLVVQRSESRGKHTLITVGCGLLQGPPEKQLWEAVKLPEAHNNPRSPSVTPGAPQDRPYPQAEQAEAGPSGGTRVASMLFTLPQTGHRCFDGRTTASPENTAANAKLKQRRNPRIIHVCCNVRLAIGASSPHP